MSDTFDNLKDDAQLLAALHESLDDAILTKTIDGTIRSWNRGAEQMFGYSAADAIGKPVTMLFPVERVAEELQIQEKLRRGERIEHYETVRLHKDGTAVDVSLTVSPLRDESGRIVGAMNITRDITDRKRAEEKLQRSLESERNAHQETRILNDLSQALGSELNLENLVQKTTDAGRALTGARVGTFIDRGVDERGEPHVINALSFAPGESIDGFEPMRYASAFDPKLLGEGPVRIDDLHTDARFSHHSPKGPTSQAPGPLRSFLAVPVMSRTGELMGGLFFGHPDPGIFSDASMRLALGVAAQAAICIDNARLYRAAEREIAERRLAENRERDARLEAEAASRLRDEFLATVSHELRTPLNSVLGWTQLLRRATNDSQIQAQAIDAIERGARSQTRLIEDLLDMSRVISGKLRLDVQSVTLAPILEAAIDTVRPAAEAKNIRLEQLLDPIAGPVKGDPVRLQQIFWNLLTNALKFTPKGGKVQVLLERINSHVEISVSDTGSGISPEFLPFVFERFRQADSSSTRRYGGLGLGLSLVKHLVELHGGRVRAESPGDGQGSTFTVELPVAVVHQDPVGREHPTASAPQMEANGAGALANIYALIVDDDIDGCEMLRRTLAGYGARVEVATSAREALERLEALRPDILISDIGMPEMDGYEFMREVRSRGIPLPAVALTAFARTEDRVRALRAGYNTHVAKPLEPMELVAVVDSLVSKMQHRPHA